MPDADQWKRKVAQREAEEAERRRRESADRDGRKLEEQRVQQQLADERNERAAQDQMASHRRKFHCHIQGCTNASSGPKHKSRVIKSATMNGGEDYNDDKETASWVEWNEPTGLMMTASWWCSYANT